MGSCVKSTMPEILDGKALVGAGGFGCEPASGASVAGAKLLREQGVIAPSDRVVCILTGHQLKDPTATVNYHTAEDSERAAHANAPIVVPNDFEQIMEVIRDFS